MPYKNKADRTKQSLRWRENNREKSREIQREYRKRNKEKISEHRRAVKEIYRERDRAEWKFRFAIKKGWIERPPDMEFHHPDYSRPYYGAWVTPIEHRRIHNGFIPCPTCVDYFEQIESLRLEAIRERNRKGAEAANKKRWG